MINNFTGRLLIVSKFCYFIATINSLETGLVSFMETGLVSFISWSWKADQDCVCRREEQGHDAKDIETMP